MTEIPEKEKQVLIKAYKAFYNTAIKEKENSTLTTEEMNAIGQKVFDELLEKAFLSQDIPDNEQQDFEKEIRDIIKQECPDMLFDSTLEFTEKGFKKKKL